MKSFDDDNIMLSSYNFMCSETCISFGMRNLTEEEVRGKTVLEIGSLNVNGSLRQYVESLKPEKYIGMDIKEGKDVDLVCDAENIIDSFGKESFDVIISTETLEHVRNWRKVISQIKNVCKLNGIILITTRSKGFAFHEYPNDYWRYELRDIGHIFSDCVIERIERDMNHPGVFVKIRKPHNFVENNLGNYEIYSMLKERVVIGITSYMIDRDDKLKSLTEKCISSVISNIHQIGTGMNAEIVLVDCQSDLKSINVPQEVKVIKNELSNISKSWNIICNYAFYDVGCNYCLIMNNDVILTDKSLHTLMEFAINSSYGIIYGTEIINNEEDIREGYMFSCFLITKGFYEKIGDFDENLAFYANDWDYLERTKEINQPPFYYKFFITFHDRSRTKLTFQDKQKEYFELIHQKDIEYYRKKWKDKGVKLP